MPEKLEGEPEHLTRDEVLAILSDPSTIETLADGATRVRKAGMVGIGSTTDEAAKDLASKIAITITRPKWPKRKPKKSATAADSRRSRTN